MDIDQILSDKRQEVPPVHLTQVIGYVMQVRLGLTVYNTINGVDD